MDSSLKNPNSIQRQSPSAPFPPPLPSPQFHHQICQNYTHRPPMINPYYYSQPQTQTSVMNFGYVSPWISNPYGWVGYVEKRFDSRIVNDPNYRIADLSSSLGNARNGFGDVKIADSYRNCEQIKLGSLVAAGTRNVSYGDKRLVDTDKDDYYRSEIEPYLDDGRKKSSDELNRTSNEDRQEECRTVVSQTKRRNFSRSRACENVIDLSVLTVGRTESAETLPLGSSGEIHHNVGSDAGKYTSVVSVSSSGKNVAGEGSSNLQPVEETSVLLRQGLGLSCHEPAEIPSVDQSCKLDYRGLKACLSNVSLSKDTNVGASELHFSLEVKEKASACDCPPVLEMENSIAIGNMGSSGCNTDSECAPFEAQSCSAVCKVFPNGNLGHEVSHAACSLQMSTMDENLVDDPLRNNSCLEPEISVSLCHLSPSVPVSEQIQNSASPVEANGSSLCCIVEKGSDTVENMDVDIQEEEVKRDGTSGTDSSVTVSGDSVFLSGSSSTIPRLIIDLRKNETHTAANVDRTRKGKECYKQEILRDDNCAVVPAKDYVAALSLPDSQSKTTLSSISEKTQKRAKENLHSAQKSYPRSLHDTKKTANPSINVTKHHTWHRKSDTPAFPVVAAKPKVTVQSGGTFIRKGNCLFRKPSPVVAAKPKVAVQSSCTFILEGNCLLRKPSPGSLGEAQTLQRHSRPPSDSTSGECALSHEIDPLSNGLLGSLSGKADDPHFVQNGLKSFEALTKRAYAADCQPKQNPLKLESSNPSNMLYLKRKANQLVAASDIHGASNHVIPPSGPYFKRSRNQLVRNSKSLPYQKNPLSDDALDLRTAAKMVSKRSSSLSLSEYAVTRPFNPSKFSHVWRLKEALSRKATRVQISPQKILSRKSQLMKKRRTVYRRSANGYSIKKSKILSIGGSHLKWFNSNEKDSEKSEFLLDVESSCFCPPENGNQLVRNPKKRTRVLANEKVRWSLHNVRSRLAKRRNYCQFFTRFGKCNKDDGKCPYIHDPSKIAVCTKFLSGSCASPDCRLTHKVVPESMPDCYYYLQGLCNNETCPYRHVHVNQKAAICEGFLRGYCSDGKECRKKHTYTCPVFKATGCCPQESECKLHHPKNRSGEKKRKRVNEPWQKISRGRYFGSMNKDLPESERVLVKELTADGAVFGGASPDFLRLDFSEHKAIEYTNSSTAESASDDCETRDLINELIRPVGLMQE